MPFFSTIPSKVLIKEVLSTPIFNRKKPSLFNCDALSKSLSLVTIVANGIIFSTSYIKKKSPFAAVKLTFLKFDKI
ncbi:hypothetical protein D3C86_1675630 [compost metagenome]